MCLPSQRVERVIDGDIDGDIGSDNDIDSDINSDIDNDSNIVNIIDSDIDSDILPEWSLVPRVSLLKKSICCSRMTFARKNRWCSSSPLPPI